MNTNYTSYIQKFAWVTVLLFCVRILVSEHTLIADIELYDIWGYAGESIAASMFMLLLYDKWLWRLNPFRKIPKLKKKYKGIIISKYDGKEREAELEIKQTSSAITVTLKTNESTSGTVSSCIENIQNRWKLIYCYLNEPNAMVRDRSAIHYGTAILCIDNPDKIQGTYFTDRLTTGDMTFDPYV